MGYNPSELRARVERVIGQTTDWHRTASGWCFHTDAGATLPLIGMLADALNTTKLNFDFARGKIEVLDHD